MSIIVLLLHDCRCVVRSNRCPLPRQPCGLTSLIIMAGIVASTLRRKAMHKKHTVDNRQLVSNHSRRHLYSPITIFTARRVYIARTMPWQNVCPSVRPSQAGIVSKQLYIFSHLFSPSGSLTILVLPNQTGWRYSNANPRNGGVECRGGMKKITICDQ